MSEYWFSKIARWKHLPMRPNPFMAIRSSSGPPELVLLPNEESEAALSGNDYSRAKSIRDDLIEDSTVKVGRSFDIQ
jgi:hypothetical protein